MRHQQPAETKRILMEKTVPVQTTIGVVCMNEEDRQEDVRLLLRRIHQWAEQMERLQLGVSPGFGGAGLQSQHESLYLPEKSFYVSG